MDRDSFLQLSAQILHETTVSLNDSMLEIHQQHFEAYKEICDRLYDSLREKTEQNTAASLLKNLYAFTQSIRKEIKSLHTITGLFSEKNLWNEWEHRIDTIAADLPEIVSLAIPDTFWLPQAGDSQYRRFRKWLRRSRIKTGNASVGFLNYFRRLFRQESIPPLQPIRSFHYQLFLANYVKIPFAHHLISEWHLVLKHISLQLFTVHESNTEFYALLRTIMSRENISTNTVNQSIDVFIRSLDDHRDLVQKLIRQNQEYKNTSSNRCTETFASISREFTGKWEQAGTFMLPVEKFSIRSFQRRKNDAEELFTRVKKAWNNHFAGEAEDWQRDIELSAIQQTSTQSCIDILESIDNRIETTVIPPIKEIHESISGALDRFRQYSPDEKTVLLNAILNENQTLVRSLRQEKLPYVMESVNNADIEAAFASFTHALQQEINELSDTYRIIKRRAIDTMPPESETDIVSIKDIIREEIFMRISGEHASHAQIIHTRIERALREISEIDQIVEYTLNSAVAIMEEHPQADTIENSRSVVIEGFERAHLQIEELQGEFGTIAGIARSGLTEITCELNDTIQKMADNDKVFELKIRLARAKTRKKLRKTITVGYAYVKTYIRASIPFIIQIAGKLRIWYSRFRKLTGLAAPVQSIDVQLAQYLTESQHKIAKLPYVYRRLFSSDPLMDRRFFGARAEEMEEIRRNFSLWRDGKNMSMVIVGESGSGKTTLLNFAENDILSGFPIIKINLLHTINTETGFIESMGPAFGMADIVSMDEMETRIIERNERQICVFENLHNLFLRTVDGLDTIERFLLFVMRTQKNIFWLVTSNLYGWNYLDSVLQISQYFYSTLFLDILSKEDISDITSRRHRVSGYSILFEIPEDVKKSRQFKKLTSDEEQQAFLQNHLFDQIVNLSSGNIRLAILFWLTSIKDITKEYMVLSPDVEFDYTFIYQLSPKELFTLAAIIQHENLTLRDHASIFNREIQDSVMLLDRMLNRGLLIQNGDEYMIHPFLYRPVARALKSKNILQ